MTEGMIDHQTDLQYVSTRGGMQPATFTEVLLDGLAPDGGLVVPQTIPHVSAEQRESWRSLTYPQLAAKVIALYATDIPTADLEVLTAKAYGPERFPDPVVPLTPLDDRTVLVGLSQGPTMAFKDLAMQFLGEAMPYVLARRGRRLNILGATSGDTGSAAEHAFRGKPGISVFMLSPQGRMSDVQRAQMYSITDDNVHNIAIDGVFDDCQNIVKAINGDAQFKADQAIGAVNSINFGRISAQIVYYFWAWMRATDAVAESDRAEAMLSVAVPSGNFGNIYAGHLSRSMGLPIDRLILATNENNVLDDFFRTGVYVPRSREETLATSSPSMDISKASNLERFIWELLGTDAFPERWAELQRTGRLDLSAELPRLHAEFGFISGTSTHADRLASIRSTYEHSGVVIDPHTADGVTVAHELDVPGLTLVLETALPAKFSDTVHEALGDDVDVISPAVRELLQQPQHVVDLPDDVDAVRAYLEEHALTAQV